MGWSCEQLTCPTSGGIAFLDPGQNGPSRWRFLLHKDELLGVDEREDEIINAVET